MTACRLCAAPLAHARRLVLGPAPSGAQRFAGSTRAARTNAIVLTIVQCPSCGLVQSSSAPVADHRRVVTAAGFSEAMRAHRARQMRAFAERFTLAGKSVVEIGSGSGYALALLAEAGMHPHGTEWGGAPAGYAGRWPVANAYPERGQAIPGAPFAAFVCFNFLEHAADPRAFLEGIAGNLTPDGVGLIEVPNYAQLRRLERAFDYVADHLSYFDAESLASALSLSGFVVERVAEVRDGENLEAWVRRRPPVALERDAQLITDTRAALAAFIAERTARGARLAVWGASHQALTLLAGVPAGGLIGIFDSAPFKQGRFAPVSALPVLAPTAEAVKDLAAVLIVAAGYEREIARTLREALAFRGELWTISGREIRPLD